MTRSLREGILTQEELTCKELTELITDYLEERLSPVDRIRFHQHLSVCIACVTYVEQMRATIKALNSRPAVDIPPDIQSTLLEAFRRWKEHD